MACNCESTRLHLRIIQTGLNYTAPFFIIVQATILRLNTQLFLTWFNCFCCHYSQIVQISTLFLFLKFGYISGFKKKKLSQI